MITVTEMKGATRERVTHLERRFGRRKVHIAAAVGGVLLIVFALRTCSSRHKVAAPPPPRPVAVAKVITRDVPLYLDEIGTCAAAETVQLQAPVNGQIISRDFEDAPT